MVDEAVIITERGPEAGLGSGWDFQGVIWKVCGDAPVPFVIEALEYFHGAGQPNHGRLP